jgi:hypothetical protein
MKDEISNTGFQSWVEWEFGRIGGLGVWRCLVVNVVRLSSCHVVELSGYRVIGLSG